jgi:hypothetical protein
MQLDLQQPRRLSALVATAARVYRDYCGQFLCLAGVLVVPFEIAWLVATGGPHSGKLTAHREAQLMVFLIAEFVLIIPLVSALQAHAVLLIGRGEQPRLAEVFRNSVRVLPTVVAASVVAAIGVVALLGAGLVVSVIFLVPGIWLLLRLYVVAQTAAIEGADWPTTLRRGFAITRGSSWRIFGMLLTIVLINLALSSAANTITGSHGGALFDVLAVVVTLLSQSFSALLGALLYFDLRAREQFV